MGNCVNKSKSQTITNDAKPKSLDTPSEQPNTADTPVPETEAPVTDAGTACTENSQSDGNDKPENHHQPIDDEQTLQNSKSNSMDADEHQTKTEDLDDEADAAKSAYTFCGIAFK